MVFENNNKKILSVDFIFFVKKMWRKGRVEFLFFDYGMGPTTEDSYLPVSQTF